MKRLLNLGAVALATMSAACSNVSPSSQQLKLVDSFLAALNAGDFDALYEMHSTEFQVEIPRADATKRYKEFRAWAGQCKRLGDAALGAQETASRRSIVVRTAARCGCGLLEQEFVLGDAKDFGQVSAFRWKKEGA